MADEEVVVPDKISSKDVEKSSSDRRRAVSPYHERCFPGYCESAAAVDKQTLSKMKRADLEDKYIVYADENLTLKKRIRDHEKQIQRLTVALARQDQADRKTGVKAAYDTVRAENLESQNKSLQAKVKVLTQQLMNHSYIHSKENRLAEDRAKKSSPQPSHRDVSQSASQSPVRKAEDSDNLKQRIVALEQMLEAQKKKYKTRISQLEKELAATPKTSADLGDQISQHSKQLNDNLEIIKLRRQNNEMAEKLDALKDQLTINEKELSQVRDALKKVTEKSEDLEEKLNQEKEKAREAQSLAVKSVSNTEIIRGLEEQIRDLQKEKELLKETNEKLLEITTGPQSKSERSIHEAKLKQQISLLETRLKDKIKELEEKEEQFMKMEALYEESKTRTPKQVKSNTGSEKSHHKEEIERLKEQLILALGENEDMKKTLDILKANMEDGTQDEKDDKDNSELLKENENLRQELENIRSQGDQESDELKSKLAVALLEIEDLKKQLNDGAGEMVPKSDYELLKTQLDEALKENLDLKHELEQNTQGQELVPKDSKLEKELEEANNEIIRLRLIVEEQMQGQEVVAKDSKLEKELEEANNEIIRLRHAAEEQMQGQEVVAKDSKLEKELEEANNEIIRLKLIVEEQMQGQEVVAKDSKLEEANNEIIRLRHAVEEQMQGQEVVAKDSKLEKDLEEANNEIIRLKNVVELMEGEDVAKERKLAEALEDANNEIIRLRLIVDEQMQGRESDDRDSTVEKELAEAIIEINRLRVIADEHAQCEQRPPTPCKSERSTSTTLIEKYRPSTPKSEKSVHSAKPSSHNIEQSRPSTPTKSEKSVRLEPSSHSVVNKISSHKGGEDVEELKAQLCSALIENQQLRKALEQCDTEPTKVVVKDSKLQNELASALSEVERLKKIAAEHEHCPKSCTQLVSQKSKVTIVEKTPEPSPVQSKTFTDSAKFAECEDNPLIKPTIEPSRVKLMKTSVTEEDSDEKSSETNVNLNHSDLPPLTPSLEALKWLLMRRQASTRTCYPELFLKLDYDQKTTKSQEKLGTALVTKFEVTKINSPHNINQTSSNSVSIEEHYVKTTSIEIESIDYQQPAVSPSVDSTDGHGVRETSLRPAQSLSAVWKNALLLYKTRDEILKVCLIQGSLSKSPPLKSYSEHQIEEIPPEPVHKPNLVIVSKHEFDAILLKKKKYYTESEVTVLDDGKEILNCRMEICMYDLEMDQDMLDYLRDIEEDPHVFLDWSFLGLDQRTIAMPASQALFHTNVVYYGPLSQNMSEYMKENTMPVCLMLAKSKSEGLMVGSGELDLFPAIKNPGRAYMRGVHFKVKKGSATVYCSFKMHGCCPGEPPKGESIEVGIGHLQLNNADEIPDKSTHLYVEYSLLGYCGGELETDSIPKSEVMRFNYTKRLRVNDHNASKLEPLLQSENPEPLKFILLSEPCSLSKGTEVEEVGTAQINLMKDMVEKDKDVVSAQLPVTNKNGEELGRLSVTIIGIDTLLEHTEHKKKEKAR